MRRDAEREATAQPAWPSPVTPGQTLRGRRRRAPCKRVPRNAAADRRDDEAMGGKGELLPRVEGAGRRGGVVAALGLERHVAAQPARGLVAVGQQDAAALLRKRQPATMPAMPAPMTATSASRPEDGRSILPSVHRGEDSCRRRGHGRTATCRCRRRRAASRRTLRSVVRNGPPPGRGRVSSAPREAAARSRRRRRSPPRRE